MTIEKAKVSNPSMINLSAKETKKGLRDVFAVPVETASGKLSWIQLWGDQLSPKFQSEVKDLLAALGCTDLANFQEAEYHEFVNVETVENGQYTNVSAWWRIGSEKPKPKASTPIAKNFMLAVAAATDTNEASPF